MMTVRRNQGIIPPLTRGVRYDFLEGHSETAISGNQRSRKDQATALILLPIGLSPAPTSQTTPLGLGYSLLDSTTHVPLEGGINHPGQEAHEAGPIPSVTFLACPSEASEKNRRDLKAKGPRCRQRGCWLLATHGEHGTQQNADRLHAPRRRQTKGDGPIDGRSKGCEGAGSASMMMSP